MAKKPSCADCPSRLDPQEAGPFFGKNIGVPMCAQFGYILGWEGISKTQKRTLEREYAEACKKFGASRPLAPPEQPDTRISTPSVNAVSRMASEKDERDVRSCQSCLNLIDPREVSNKFDISAPLCAAKGRIIFDRNFTREAKDCPFRRRPTDWTAASASTLLGTMSFLPIYERALEGGVIDPVKAFLQSGGNNLIDPQDYESDAPVSDEDRADGIRAWRKVVDPTTGTRHVFLPIFDIDSFSDEERSKIPRTGDDEHPEWYADAGGYVYALAVEWMVLDETPALWGEAGVGKTELVRHMAWLMSAPFERITITRSSDIEDLAGKYVLKNSETHFQEGRVVRAWRKTGVLLIDEPNVGPDDVWQFFRPLTDNSRQLVLDMAEGQRVERDLHCYFAMAMNPSWDPKNIGTNEIGDADGNRLAHVFLHPPDPRVERLVIKRRCEADGWTPSDKVLDFVMGVADDIRSLAREGDVPLSWNVRPNIQVARHLRWFDPVTAYKRAVTDMHDPEVGKMILNFVETRLDRDEDLMGDLDNGEDDE